MLIIQFCMEFTTKRPKSTLCVRNPMKRVYRALFGMYGLLVFSFFLVWYNLCIHLGANTAPTTMPYILYNTPSVTVRIYSKPFTVNTCIIYTQRSCAAVCVLWQFAKTAFHVLISGTQSPNSPLPTKATTHNIFPRTRTHTIIFQFTIKRNSATIS